MPEQQSKRPSYADVVSALVGQVDAWWPRAIINGECVVFAPSAASSESDAVQDVLLPLGVLVPRVQDNGYSLNWAALEELRKAEGDVLPE